MKKLLLMMLLVTAPAWARAKLQGYCQNGGVQSTVNGSGATVAPRVQASYPGCTVTVYLNATLTLATIYSTSGGAAKANPFTASNSTGLWGFYADDATRVDVKLSGGGIASPFTLSDFLFPSAGGITTLNGLTGASQNFATGTSGTDFAISSSGTTHTFNIPNSSGSNRGLLTSTDWTTFNGKQDALMFTSPLVNTAGTVALTLPITIARGGTGQTTQTLGFNALSPLTTKGDIIVHNGTNNIRFPKCTDGLAIIGDSGQASGLNCTAVGPGTVTHTGTLTAGQLALGNAGVDIAVGTLADDTANNVTAAQHGLVPKAPGNNAQALCGDGNWGTTCAPSGAVAIWTSYTVLAIANGVNGCVNANGCWQVNGTLGANKTAGLTQNVTLFQLAANGFIEAYRIKSAVACTGTTTLTTGLGTASSSDFYLATAGGYNLQSAVSNTNITTAAPVAFGSDTAAAVNIVSSLTATVANIDQIVAGCSWKVSVLSGVLP